MRICSKVITLLFGTMVFLGCDKNGEVPQGNQPDPQRPLPAELSLVFNEDFASRVRFVQKDKTGNIWVGRSAEKSAGSAPSSFVEHRRQNGDLLQPPFELGEGNLAGLAALDDGSLIAALLVDDKHLEAYYALKLVAISADGETTREKRFEEFMFQHPNGYACKFSEAEKGYFSPYSLSIASYENRFLLMNYNCAYSRLSLLDKTFGTVWTKEISTQRSDSALFYSWENVVVSPNGTIITATQIPPENIPSFNARFSESLVGMGETDILVSAFDSDGNRIFSRIAGTEEGDVPTALAASASMVVVGADVHVSRPTSVRDYQSDIWLSALDGKDGRSLWSRTIDVRDEDSLNTLQFLSDKYLAIGGNTGQLQVSTGSIVKHGDAFLMLTDLSGNILGQSVFGTDRNDYVSTLLEVEGSKILVGGTKDGPITHDGDNDKTQLHCFGFLDLISIEKILKK